jgi:transcriptional regulator with XRE-family HTH domain
MLFALRCQAGLTQDELAERVGCAQSVVSRIENACDDDLSVGDLLRYARGLDLGMQIGFTAKDATLASSIRGHLDGLSRDLRQLLDLAGDDLSILAGAASVFQGTAEQFALVLTESADRLDRVVQGKCPAAAQAAGDLTVLPPAAEESCPRAAVAR